MKKLLRIRLATIVDCEGHIGIYDHDGKNTNKPVVDVSQNERWYCERFKEIFGFGCVTKKSGKCWEYVVGYVQALIVCLELVNEMEIKRYKALKIIEFYRQKLVRDKGYCNRRKALLTRLSKYGVSFRDGKFILPQPL